MNYKVIISLLLLSISTAMFYSCRSSKIDRTTLFKGSNSYPWKIEYVKEDNFPAVSKQYYQVYYNNELLFFRKEVFGSNSDISKFIAAGGFEISAENRDCVLLTFENITKKEDGFNNYEFITVLVRKLNNGKAKPTFLVTDLNYGKSTEFELNEHKSQ